MVEKKSWKEFQGAGLLWWINTMLHMFGWAIVLQYDDDEIVEVYPARVKFRGFKEENNTSGYQKVTNYLKENVEQLYEETLH